MRRRKLSLEDFRWTNITVLEIEAMKRQTIETKKMYHEDIKKIPHGHHTFTNTIMVLEHAHAVVAPTLNILDLIMNVSPNATTREAAQNTIDELQKTLIDIEYDEEIFSAVKEVCDQHATPLSHPADEKMLRDTLRNYRRMGFELPQATRDHLKGLMKRENELSLNFLKNINDYQDFITVSRDELDGLPENYIQRLKKDEQGRYIVTLEYPHYFPFIENAKSTAKRQELMDQYSRKGGEKNLIILRELLQLRHEVARLLGFSHHADYQTEVRMVQNASTVQTFLDRLMSALKPTVQREIDDLRQLKAEETGSSECVIEYYDVPYYINQHKKKMLHLDEEKLREYFPFSQVKHGIFSLFSHLFSIQFERIHNLPTWHEDVEVYAIKEKGDILSYFMLDLYPREGKFSHAAVFSVIPGHVISSLSLSEKMKESENQSDAEAQEYQPPIACLVANFPKPSAQQPSLLSHSEVATFFHEFGHVMHDVLTEATYSSQSGTAVARDFVEAPSQMFEYWVWEKEILPFLSKKYDSAEPIPQALLALLQTSKKHMVASSTMRQLVFALFDLLLHTQPTTEQPTELYSDLMEKYCGYRSSPMSLFPSGFGHLVGYDAGYYGYCWSKVYAADLFTRFQKKGLLNASVGMSFRRTILAVGGSRNENELLHNFLGRDASEESFLAEIGVVEQTPHTPSLQSKKSG